jgi:hypothetical protein
MRKMDKYLTLLMPVGGLGEKASETIQDFELRRNEC